MSDKKKRAYTIRSPRKVKAPVPLERVEQKLLVSWLRANGYRFFAAPSSVVIRGANRFAQINALKSTGWSTGFPDMLVVLKAGGICCIELKRADATVLQLSDEQREWIHALSMASVWVNWCKGAAAAIEWIQTSERGCLEEKDRVAALGKLLPDVGD